jgi:MFS family permease
MSDFDRPGRRRWIVTAFAALTILIILLALAFLVSGREVIERPILVFFILLAWFGTLGGIAISREDD